jgi:ribonuclease M5
LVKKLSETNDIILFLDPDATGERIRKLFESSLTKFTNCYITRDDILPGSKKIGIAEASDESIIKAFNNLLILDKTLKPLE